MGENRTLTENKSRWPKATLAQRLVGGLVVVGITTAPLTGPSLYTAVNLLDTMDSLKDPQKRGLVYADAVQTLHEAWPPDTANVLVEALDRFDARQSLNLPLLLPRVVASAYGLLVDYGPVTQAWSRQDEADILQRFHEERLTDVVQSRLKEIHNSTYPEYPPDSLALKKEAVQTAHSLGLVVGKNDPESLQRYAARILEYKQAPTHPIRLFTNLNAPPAEAYALSELTLDKFFATLALNPQVMDESPTSTQIAAELDELANSIAWVEGGQADFSSRFAIQYALQAPDLKFSNRGIASGFVLLPVETQRVVDEVLQLTQFDSDDDALYYAAVAASAFREKGISTSDRDRAIRDMIGFILHSDPIVAKNLARLEQFLGREPSVVDKILTFRRLVDVLDSGNLIGHVHEFVGINKSFVVIDGKTFDGVMAQLDPKSLFLTADPAGYNSELAPNQVSIVMPWSYFLPSDAEQINNHRLIEFAATREFPEDEFKIVSALTEIGPERLKNAKYFSIGFDGTMTISLFKDESTKDFLERMNAQNIKSIFVPNWYYDAQSQDQSLIGFGDDRLSSHKIVLLIIGQDSKHQNSLYAMFIKSKTWLIDEQDLMFQITSHIPGEVSMVMLSDPGHSVYIRAEDGRTLLYPGLNETETNRIVATINGK